jgi:hypothetical protein
MIGISSLNKHIMLFNSSEESLTKPPLLFENLDINFLRGIKVWIVGTFFSIYTAIVATLSSPSLDPNNPNSIPAQFGSGIKDALTSSPTDSPSAKSPMGSTKPSNGPSQDMSSIMNQLSGANPVIKNPKGAKNAKIPTQGLREMQRQRQMAMMNQQPPIHQANQFKPGQFM